MIFHCGEPRGAGEDRARGGRSWQLPAAPGSPWMAAGASSQRLDSRGSPRGRDSPARLRPLQVRSGFWDRGAVPAACRSRPAAASQRLGRAWRIHGIGTPGAAARRLLGEF